jgi:hypothetical protein
MSMPKSSRSGEKKITYLRDDRSAEERKATDEKRWKRNRIDDQPEGFTLTSANRFGTIYFREGTRVLEIATELAGDPSLDIVVFLDGLNRWIEVGSHSTRALSPDDQQRIETLLRSWLANQKMRFSLK